jgi:hypothetical protein
MNPPLLGTTFGAVVPTAGVMAAAVPAAHADSMTPGWDDTFVIDSCAFPFRSTNRHEVQTSASSSAQAHDSRMMEEVVMRRVVPLAFLLSLALVAACSDSSAPSKSSAFTPGSAMAPAAAAAVPVADPNLDSATHARLHVVALDKAVANVDVLVDGAIANNGGQAQAMCLPDTSPPTCI